MAKSIPTERFLDVNSEPQRRLSPIQGYELQPLVSLEVAVRPLESIISNIQGFVWTATGNCENPKDRLEPNESASIYLYTMECMYRQLNVALRSEDRKQLVAYFPYLKLFLTALWKLDNVNSVVWRDIKKNIADQYPQGKKFVWWCLSSCTTTLSVLQVDTFLGETDPRTLFYIQCFNVVDAIKQGPNFHIIHIKQIEPPVALIQPPSPSLNKNCSEMNVSSTALASKNTDKVFKLDILKKKPRLSMHATALYPTN